MIPDIWMMQLSVELEAFIKAEESNRTSRVTYDQLILITEMTKIN
jgi:hypothetical protein